MPTFGEVLCELREDAGITQKQLANELHMAPTTISSYETGKILPPPDKLVAIADYFCVTTDYLLGRTSYNINPRFLSEKIAGKQTVTDFVLAVKSMSKDQKEALMTVVGDMKFSADYQKNIKKED